MQGLLLEPISSLLKGGDNLFFIFSSKIKKQEDLWRGRAVVGNR